MRVSRGFTLIELMITVAVVAILAAVAYPSYQAHIAKGQRSQGQQVLSDVAQRQEQYLLDRRQYARAFGSGSEGLGLKMPDGAKYDAPDFSGVGTGNPPSYVICMSPSAGSVLASRNDGRLCINNRGEQWRESDNNGQFDATDCAWTNSTCKVSGES